jgi:hypothetical protein
MSSMRRVLFVPVLLLIVTPSHAVDVPIVGRLEHFNEAVGSRFHVSSRAYPTDLYVGKSLTYTVRVQAFGKHVQAPQRPRLEDVPSFVSRFHIARSVGKQPDRTLTDQRAWEFDYRLEPKNDKVERIPPLPFSWYRPNSDSKQPGLFMMTFAEEIDIKVKPVLITQTKPAAPIQAPEEIFQIATGPRVLRSQQLFILPDWPMLALLLAGPPLLAGLWYAAWRRLYPDAARRARVRRSRAAMQALRALEALDLTSPALVVQVPTITANYLQARFDLQAIEPTPLEVAMHLCRAGVPDTLAEQAADFFRVCDAARFAPAAAIQTAPRPAPPASGWGSDLAAEAHRLIVALEGEPCSQRSS